MEIIHTEKAPAAIGPYSQAIRVGNMVYLSGQVGIDPSVGKLVSGGIEAEAEQAARNVEAILAAAGTDIAHVVKTTCFLADMADFAAFNAVYAKHFISKPARSCVAAKALPAGACCEIESIAVVE